METDYLDESALDEIIEGAGDANGDILFELAAVYRSTSTELVTKIEQMFQSQSAEGVSEASHSLKSSSAALGLLKVAKLAEYLEHSAGQLISQNSRTAIDELKTEFFQSLKVLEAVLAAKFPARKKSA